MPAEPPSPTFVPYTEGPSSEELQLGDVWFALFMVVKAGHQLTAAEALVVRSGTQDTMGATEALGGGASGQAGAKSGGRAGGRLGARFLRPQTATTGVDLPGDPDHLRQAAIETIGALGSVITNPTLADDGSVWGLVPSGALDMSVALVRVHLESAGPEGETRVSIRGSGNEGLIKQKIGEGGRPHRCAARGDLIPTRVRRRP